MAEACVKHRQVARRMHNFGRSRNAGPVRLHVGVFSFSGVGWFVVRPAAPSSLVLAAAPVQHRWDGCRVATGMPATRSRKLKSPAPYEINHLPNAVARGHLWPTCVADVAVPSAGRGWATLRDTAVGGPIHLFEVPTQSLPLPATSSTLRTESRAAIAISKTIRSAQACCSDANARLSTPSRHEGSSPIWAFTNCERRGPPKDAGSPARDAPSCEAKRARVLAAPRFERSAQMSWCWSSDGLRWRRL